MHIGKLPREWLDWLDLNVIRPWHHFLDKEKRIVTSSYSSREARVSEPTFSKQARQNHLIRSNPACQSMNDVRFGINMPQFHPDNSAELASLGKFASYAESLGFDSLWTLGGIFGDGPFLEPLSSLAYVAAVTKKMMLGTAVLLLPLRVPTIIAKVTATIDFLSSGRLILGAALGGRSDEFVACGVPINERVARFNEGIKIIRMLWTEDRVNFKGRLWQLENATISPKPAQARGYKSGWAGAR